MVKLDVNALKVEKAKLYIPSWYFIRLFKVSTAHEYDNEYGEGHYELSSGAPKLEGTRGEHWSPEWRKIVAKYLLEDGSTIIPEELPYDEYVSIQTNPDREVRKKNMVWAIPAELISEEKFMIGGLVIDPELDMLCMGGDETGPNLDWGAWPVKKDIFADTYEEL